MITSLKRALGTVGGVLLLLASGQSQAAAQTAEVWTISGTSALTGTGSVYSRVTLGQTWSLGSFGWAGWSVPTGKVVTGARIVSGGPYAEFQTFRPARPNDVFPHYTYGANEYGWVIQNALNGPNLGVQIEVFYADEPTGYAITMSNAPIVNNVATATGPGSIVYGGGYSNLGERVVSSQALGTNAWEVTVVPEPSTYALMAAGLAGLFVAGRRRRRTA